MNSGITNKFGLTERDMQTIRDILKKYPEVITVWLFGSRAKGTFKKGSDIDLAIMNEGVNNEMISRIKSDFEASSLPYRVDITNYSELGHKKLKEHIERVGVPFIFISSRLDDVEHP